MGKKLCHSPQGIYMIAMGNARRVFMKVKSFTL
jgi:hypothetical protein